MSQVNSIQLPPQQVTGKVSDVVIELMAELKLESVPSSGCSPAKTHVDPYASIRTCKNYPNDSDMMGHTNNSGL